jgi:uncharacterized membrane protein YidH (DUF202 family)
MNDLIEKFIDFTSNTGRTAILSMTAALNGLVIDTFGVNMTQASGMSLEFVETLFKHSSWTVSILLGIFGVVTWIQKQKDRYETKKQLRNKKIKK